MDGIEYEEVVILIKNPCTPDEAFYVLECNIVPDVMRRNGHVKVEGVYRESANGLLDARRRIKDKWPQ
jgi:hypothetical protein